MNNIEEMLRTASKQDFEVPQKIQYRVKYTLKNKEKQKLHLLSLQRLIATIVSVIMIFVGGISGYALCGGTISGKPVIEWLGIKFSSNYENYKENVVGQEIYNNETSISLTSTVCDEGFTILEFDVKLSKEDKEKLKLGEEVLTEEYLNSIDIDPDTKQSAILEYTGKTIDSIYISLNNKIITDETGTYVDSLNNYKIIIDGKEFWIRPRSAQTATKVSDYEYKVYQMYFLTDKELKEKKEFEITLENVVLTANYTQTLSEDVYIPIEGKFNVKVSKEKTSQDTKIVAPNCEQISNKNVTQKVEKIICTPLQTIVKVSLVYDNVSLKNLTSEKSEDYIDNIIYEAVAESGKELGTFAYETKRIITYENGEKEEWEQGDVGTGENFKNATMELTKYIVIEKDDESSKIKLTTKEQSKKGTIGSVEINLEV